jgi:hypothetical protein
VSDKEKLVKLSDAVKRFERRRHGEAVLSTYEELDRAVKNRLRIEKADLERANRKRL